jgi:hypothetical protein
VKRASGVSALLVLTLISACGPQASKTPARLSPSASPTATAIPTESASATAAGTTAPQGLTCKLPVVTNNDAGWLTFPGATYQSDPRANVHLSVNPTGPVSKSYDKAFERWLPVARDSISPDGKHYVYSDPPYPGMYAQGSVPPSRVHVVDIASGVDHSFNPGNLGTDSSWWVLDYENEGVYLAELGYGPSAPVGLWLLDPSNGGVRQIDNTHLWEALTGHGPGPGSRLMRMDLKTGAIGSWYKRTDVEFIVGGADAAGNPVLQVTTLGSPAIILVTAQNTGAPLPVAPGTAVPMLSNYIHPVSDSHGMWFGDVAGNLSLYTAATGIKKMAQVGSAEVTAGGGCH